jgi:hypothetical protein
VIPEVTHLLLEAGLVQFGRFNNALLPTPFHLSLEMLPSYPHVLRVLVNEAKALLSPFRVDRILCTPDAVPFGVGLSLETNIPLVYSRGRNESRVRTLVGAYDIGHPAILVTNILSSFKPLSQIVSDARRVGLDTHTVLAIVDLGIASLPQDMRVASLVRLLDLALTDQLPPDQRKAVLNWITTHSQEDERVPGEGTTVDDGVSS